MLKQRIFRIIKVGQMHGVGEGITDAADTIVRYDGEAQVIILRPASEAVDRRSK
jgi:hypothetical protein